MKVVLKVTVFDRIMKEISAAQRDRRVVDYVVVSDDDEYAELTMDRRTHSVLNYGYAAFNPTLDMPLTIETKEFPLVNKGHAGYPFMRAYSREFIAGAKLYVVPEAYCPR